MFPIRQTVPINLTIPLLVLSVLPYLLIIFGIDLTFHFRNQSGVLLSSENEVVHLFFDLGAVIIGCVTLPFALAHFRLRGDPLAVVIGMGLGAASILFGLHTLIVNHIIPFAVEIRSAAAASWTLAQTYYVLALIGGVSYLHLTHNRREELTKKNLSYLVAFVFLGALVAGITLYTIIQRPWNYTLFYGNAITKRPLDLIPLFLWVYFGIFYFLFFYQKRRTIFSSTLLLSMIPLVASQFHMTFGTEDLGDNHANSAHLLLIVGFSIPFLGIVANYFKVHRDLEQSLELKVCALAMDSVKNGILITDPNLPDNPIVYCNQAFSDLTGYSRAEVLGKNPRFLHERDPQQSGIEDLRKAVQHKSQGSSIVRNYKKTGEMFWCEVTVAPVFDGQGHLVNYVGSQNDVTSKRMAEVAEIERARAVASDEAKSLFLATMSHEIRSPLTSIIGFSELLSGFKYERPEQAEYIRKILKNSNHLQRLVNDILDLTRLESSEFQIKSTTFSLRDEFETAVNSFKIHGKKGLSLKLTFDPSVPQWIETDLILLRQVLINLLSNAVKFTRHGDVTVTVSFDPPTTSLTFSVCDTGCGIPIEHQKDIFKLFHRAHDDPALYPGTGLGLNLCQKIVNRLSGRIELIESVVGKGSRFDVTIPVKSVTPSKEASEDRNPKDLDASVRSALEGKRILVVDDSEDIRFLFKRLLGKVGAQIREAEDGPRGIALSNKEPFDLILIDVQMPGMNGRQATKVMRSQGFDRPIIALTASATNEERESCLAAGCSDFCGKPITSEALLNKITSWI